MTHSPIQRAEGKIKLALVRLAADYPFHARVLEQFRVQFMAGLATMAVTIRGEEPVLLYSPDFVLELLADELVGVLLHEVNHVVLGHVLADPEDYPDEWARTVAEEVTANEFVKKPLPKGVVKLEQFPTLPALESTAKRYKRLKKVRSRPLISPAPGAGEPMGSKSTGTNPGDAQASKSKPGQPDEHLGGVATVPDKSPAAQVKSPAGQIKTLDDHSLWQEARKDPQAALETIRKVLQEAAFEAGTTELPATLREALGDAGIGTTPGDQQYQLDGDRQGRLGWRHLLHRYLGQELKPHPVLSRPPRRRPELVGIVPARSRRPLKPKIMAALDTSGSLTDDLLEMIDSELCRLARYYSVVVVECDVAIHRVRKYRPLDNLLGRGGTDLRPPLEREFLRKHRPDVVVYFTDGEGPAPASPPAVPVIWCLTPHGTAPARWGRTIWLQE